MSTEDQEINESIPYGTDTPEKRMSTEQSVDPDLVEQTKQQIRNLVREIAQLSRSEMAPLEYYDALLNRIVTALAAVGGAIWTVAEGGRLELEYQINLRETRLVESQENQVRHGRLLHKALTSGEGMLVAPQSGPGGEEEGGNPTDFLLVLGPLKSDQETLGLIEVFQRPGSSPTVQRGYLRFLMQMCELASDYLKTRQLRHYSNRQTMWGQLENFTRVTHRTLDPRLTAYTIANEGRRLIECDRVSVALFNGRKCKIEAVSGQDTFDSRSNTITMLAKLATAVVATGDVFWYTGDTTYMAPQVEEAVQAYVDESHSKTVGVIPLKRHQENLDPGAAVEPPEIVGALIVEQIEDSRPKEGMLQRVEIVTEHSAMALANAMEHEHLFLMPLWRSIGKAQWVLKARTLPKTLAITGAVLLVVLVLWLWPATLTMYGKGELQPKDRREVFSALDGVVTEVNAAHGQKVEKGQLLVVMRNYDLEKEIFDVTGQLDGNKEQKEAITRTLDGERHLSNEEQSRLNGQKLQLEMQINSLDQQLKLLKYKQDQLQIRSPIKGEVTTWQVRDLLIDRPVQKGQVLVSVADPEGDWELEVHMAEDKMGHINQAEKKLAPGEKLKVGYILATDPAHNHEGTVEEIERHAEVHGEEGNTVLLRVSIDQKDLKDEEKDLRRRGANVSANVNCGRTSLGYRLFHPVIEFIDSRLLFRWFW